MSTKPSDAQIAQFVLDHCEGIYTEPDRGQIEQYVMLHKLFGTMMVVMDHGEIIAVCRWNWTSSTSAKILDLIIRPDFRNKHIARNMILKAKRAMPQLESISFHRKKYAMRQSGFPVSRWLKEKSYVG